MRNPLLHGSRISEAAPTGAELAAFRGVVTKSFILGGLCLFTAAAFWFLVPRFTVDHVIQYGLGWPVVLSPFVCAVIIGLIFGKPSRSVGLAPVFAVLMGSFLGGLAGIAESGMPGLVSQTVLLTLVAFFSLLIAYATGFIRVTDEFMTAYMKLVGVLAVFTSIDATLNILYVDYHSLVFAVYPISMAFSAMLVLLSAGLLLVDFSFVAETYGEGKSRAPDYMEWYCAFGLLTSVIWQYLAIFFLLGRGRSSK